MKLEFFEKKGCKNNNRQASLLEAAGIELIRIDLIQYAWNAQELLYFLQHLKVVDWFNPTAPKIVEGKIKPTQLSPQEALTLLLQDPLLIRRPLLRQGDKHLAGFDPERIEALFGIPLLSLVNEAEQNPAKFQETFVHCKKDHSCSE